jgi:hypothetical protein
MTNATLAQKRSQRWAAEPDGTQSGLSTFEQTSERPTQFHLSHQQLPLCFLLNRSQMMRQYVPCRTSSVAFTSSKNWTNDNTILTRKEGFRTSPACNHRKSHTPDEGVCRRVDRAVMFRNAGQETLELGMQCSRQLLFLTLDIQLSTAEVRDLTRSVLAVYLTPRLQNPVERSRGSLLMERRYDGSTCAMNLNGV